MILSRPVLVLFVALGLSVSFAIPAEDLPETPYDESESIPVENTATASILQPRSVEVSHAPRVDQSSRVDSFLKERAAQCFPLRTELDVPVPPSPVILDHSFRC